jgi:putative component of membrane protein insertase Oxa1/YidC/SpoIIIJ protein YidD
VLRRAAVRAISLYQIYVSPYKGFQCAYRYHTGGNSCSEYAKRIVLRFGLLTLWTALPRQFARCRAAHQALLLTPEIMGSEDPKKKRKEKRWWERCDCSLNVVPCPCEPDIEPCPGEPGSFRVFKRLPGSRR